MKNFFVFLLLCTGVLWAQSGKMITTKSVASNILKQSVSYAVYLPPSYDNSKRHYPILYLLHRVWDDYLGWAQWGDLQRIADR